MKVTLNLEREDSVRTERVDLGGRAGVCVRFWEGGSWGLLGQEVRGKAKSGRDLKDRNHRWGSWQPETKPFLLPGRVPRAVLLRVDQCPGACAVLLPVPVVF